MSGLSFFKRFRRGDLHLFYILGPIWNCFQDSFCSNLKILMIRNFIKKIISFFLSNLWPDPLLARLPQLNEFETWYRDGWPRSVNKPNEHPQRLGKYKLISNREIFSKNQLNFWLRFFLITKLSLYKIGYFQPSFIF